MSQPLDRTCNLPALGKVNSAAGEFWVENPFMMPRNGDNLSAYERNCVFINHKGTSFIDVSYASRADIDSDTRSAIASDFDRDGAPDILVGNVGGGPLRLFRNQFPQQNHRLRVGLVGKRSNRLGIGARITCFTRNGLIVRDCFPANGFMGGGPVEVLIGTGQADTIDRLVVQWPSGLIEELKGVVSEGQITITEGQGSPIDVTSEGQRVP